MLFVRIKIKKTERKRWRSKKNIFRYLYCIYSASKPNLLSLSIQHFLGYLSPALRFGLNFLDLAPILTNLNMPLKPFNVLY